MTDEYNNNTQLEAKAQSDPGRSDLYITDYEWKINGNVVETNNTDTLVIHTSDLQLGDNTLSLRVQNSCGSWSSEYSKTITITQGGNTLQQTDSITINSPTTEITIKIRRTSTVTVTVLDDDNASTPNAPINGATVEIGSISGTTDANGKATLSKVPYTNSGTITTTISI